MPTYFDQLDKASFSGIPFPVDDVTITGGIRRHQHEFPHTPASATEKLGRKNYVIRISADFHDVLNGQYPHLYPTALHALFRMWEDQVTDGLVLPTMGRIPAYCVNWTKRMSAQVRSGERVELEFEEDQSTAFALDALLAAAATALPALGDVFAVEVQALQVDPPVGIFEQINDAIDAVRAIRDSSELASNLLEAKLLAVASLCEEAERSVDQLDDPLNYRVLEALKQVWSSSVSLAEDIAQKRSPIQMFVTPSRMAITEVSQRIYGTTERSMELLQLNAVDDAFDINAGVALKYYDDAA